MTCKRYSPIPTLAAKVDVLLVLGARNSSNSARLQLGVNQTEEIEGVAEAITSRLPAALLRRQKSA
ncbi:MAG: hypothetical protein NTW90_04850 [Nitrosospira sp.]|nr:hypothetical protein [Nitrosospira sp.]